MVQAAIYGCAGRSLSATERDFFAKADPLGFILFGRNIDGPDQVGSLIRELRDAVGRPDAPIFLDQEGGRVQRLRPPHWRAAPPAARFGELAAVDLAAARRAVHLNHLLLAAELSALGFSADCAPVLDLRHPDAHEVIGDRAFGADPLLVADLGRAAMEGLLAGGVLPVVKHVPGHGRALVDSHHALPVCDSDLATLEASDFLPFRLLRDAPLAMTAHVVYGAVDPDRPATASRAVIERVIRGHMGFGGLLITDDLSMQALDGSLAERARAAREAGCDILLHCNGDGDEMQAVAGEAPAMGEGQLELWRRAKGRLGVAPTSVAQLQAGLDALLDSA